MYQSYLKPFFDISISVIVLFFGSLVFVLIVVLLYIFNNKEIFFIQARPGLNGKIFKLIKFKSMNNKVDKNGHLLSDELRLTKLGRFLRKTSLDELPQFINVLKGEMSIIGPRPLLIDYLDKYNDFQNRRHEVKPGITGWAQVNGRNAISWENKFVLDVWYVDNISFCIDFKILYLTVLKVIKKEGISGKNVETMTPFEGTNFVK